MLFSYLFWGIFIGLVMAAPLGPVNIICLRRALTFGSMNGFIVGLGAAIADGIYGSMAAFGLVSITRLLEDINGWVEIIGGSILLIVGIKLWFSHPKLGSVQDTYKDRFKAAIGTFILTMTNPMTILGFAALFIGLGLGKMGQNYANATLISTGIFLGSCFWWAILSVSAGKVSQKLSDDHLVLVNKISAVIISLFAMFAFIKNLFS